MHIMIVIFLFCIFCNAVSSAGEPAAISLDISVNLKEATLTGEARLTIPAKQRLSISTSGISVTDVLINGEKNNIKPIDDELALGPFNTASQAVVSYRKDISRLRIQAAPMQGLEHGVHANTFLQDTLVLTEEWHPRLKDYAVYDLTVTAPKDLTPVSEADSVDVNSDGDQRRWRFHFAHLRKDVSLAIGPYEIHRIQHEDVELACYLYAEDRQLARTYLDKMTYYLELYRPILGDYPFKRFAVVENRAPTGLGFATFTLLGQQVMRLPFIPDTSLGHEFVHSWFGNSVYVDFEKGNWCEGLTSYLADYLYKEKAGKGPQYRKELLVNYQSYAKDADIAVTGFRWGRDKTQRAVGYGKTAMLFHMLRNEVGDEAFYKALRSFYMQNRFRAASWNDIQKAFENASSRDLTAFWNQWLTRKDIPVLTAALEQKGEDIFLVVTQKDNPPYTLTLPVLLKTKGEDIKWQASVTQKQERIRLPRNDVEAVAVDSDFEIMRSLTAAEFPPVLARILGAQNRYFVRTSSIYDRLAETLKADGFVELPARHAAEWSKGSILWLGEPTVEFARIFGESSLPKNQDKTRTGASIEVKNNPLAHSFCLGLVQASSARHVDLLLPRLSHLGQYSTILMDNDGKLTMKETRATENGIISSINNDIDVVETRTVMNLHQALNRILPGQVVYVGEKHDEFADHMAQLKVIEELHKKGYRLAVGMEMFQRPFQDVIDAYLKGEMDERAFVEKTEYFKRWGYDYHLYRPIIRFCKENNIPIAALNLEMEISQKVAREGINSLSEEELRRIPANIDWNDETYKNLLRRIFTAHAEGPVQNFDNFYQAQLLWDETMALSAAQYLEKNPQQTLVVLAGTGHIAHRHGIPKRLKRLTGRDDWVIICLHDDLDATAADLLLSCPYLTPPFSAKLGVMLEEQENGLAIKEVSPHGAAKTAGIEAGDIIRTVDGTPVKKIPDLKLALLFKQENDSIELELIDKNKKAQRKTLNLTSMTGPLGMASAVMQHPTHLQQTVQPKAGQTGAKPSSAAGKAK